MNFAYRCLGFLSVIDFFLCMAACIVGVICAFYHFWIGAGVFVVANFIWWLFNFLNNFLYVKRKTKIKPITESNFGIRFFRLLSGGLISLFIISKIIVFFVVVAQGIQIYGSYDKVKLEVIKTNNGGSAKGFRTGFGFIALPNDYDEDFIRIDSDIGPCLFNYYCYNSSRINFILQAARKNLEQNHNRVFKDIHYLDYGKWASSLTDEDKNNLKAAIWDISSVYYLDKDYGIRWELFLEGAIMALSIVYGGFYFAFFIVAALQYLIFGRWSWEWLFSLDDDGDTNCLSSTPTAE